MTMSDETAKAYLDKIMEGAEQEWEKRAAKPGLKHEPGPGMSADLAADLNTLTRYVFDEAFVAGVDWRMKEELERLKSTQGD